MISLDPIDSMVIVMHATSMGIEHLNVGQLLTTLIDILRGPKELVLNLLCTGITTGLMLSIISKEAMAIKRQPNGEKTVWSVMVMVILL